MSLPFIRPRSMGPPLTTTAGMFKRAAAMSTGNNFIAVGDEYQTVKCVTVSNSFNAICYQFAACQRIFHTIVTHCDTIANADSREFDRSATCFQDAVFNSLGNGVQMHMTRMISLAAQQTPINGFSILLQYNPSHKTGSDELRG